MLPTCVLTDIHVCRWEEPQPLQKLWGGAQVGRCWEAFSAIRPLQMEASQLVQSQPWYHEMAVASDAVLKVWGTLLLALWAKEQTPGLSHLLLLPLWRKNRMSAWTKYEEWQERTCFTWDVSLNFWWTYLWRQNQASLKPLVVSPLFPCSSSFHPYSQDLMHPP